MKESGAKKTTFRRIIIFVKWHMPHHSINHARYSIHKVWTAEQQLETNHGFIVGYTTKGVNSFLAEICLMAREIEDPKIKSDDMQIINNKFKFV